MSTTKFERGMTAEEAKKHVAELMYASRKKGKQHFLKQQKLAFVVPGYLDYILRPKTKNK